MSTLFVCVERVGGRLTTASLELVSGAAGLAGDGVTAFVAGPPTPEELGVLGDHGAQRVVTCEVPPDRLVAPALAGVVADAARAGSPAAVLVPGTCDGRDVAATVSVLLDRPVLANVVGLHDEAGRLVADHAVFGGTTSVRAAPTAEGTAIFLLRPGWSEASPGRGLAPSLERAEVRPDPGGPRVIERREEALEGPGLEDARIVVTGGRGIGGPDRFAKITELARLLKGAPGATRAIVDAGWAPYACQVGQTGKTVTPEVYLAFGVSGATQHLVGMRNARHVVAVDLDEHAPLFALAELAVVGDAPDLLDRLIAAVAERS